MKEKGAVNTLALPRVLRRPYRDADRRRLLRWLLAWEVDREGPDEEPWAGAMPPRKPEATPPAAGQIRLLYPCGYATARCPVYCAVMDASPGVALLAAPFSRYADPALPGELLLTRMPPGLRVLAVWNAGRVPAGCLDQSWIAGSLNPRDMARALRIHAALDKGGRVPDSLRSVVGPEVHHPQDPRLEYQAQARAEWHAALAECASGPARSYVEPARLPLAAEPRTPYNPCDPPD